MLIKTNKFLKYSDLKYSVIMLTISPVFVFSRSTNHWTFRQQFFIFRTILIHFHGSYITAANSFSWKWLAVSIVYAAVAIVNNRQGLDNWINMVVEKELIRASFCLSAVFMVHSSNFCVDHFPENFFCQRSVSFIIKTPHATLNKIQQTKTHKAINFIPTHFFFHYRVLSSHVEDDLSIFSDLLIHFRLLFSNRNLITSHNVADLVRLQPNLNRVHFALYDQRVSVSTHEYIDERVIYRQPPPLH
jgi:hypothetical protein